MSTEHPETETQTVAGADAIRIRAADWLMERRVSENWGAEEQAALDVWLAESPTHLLAYWRLDAAWSRTDRLVALRSSAQSDREVDARRARPFFVKIAVALTVAAALSVAAGHYLLQPQAKLYATSVGGREMVSLTDGSHIELNTDSVLRVTADGGSRTVNLDRGEAYFEVKHDAAHPFIVIVGHHRVTDLGTKFLARSVGDNLEVAVMDGRVSFGEADERMQTQPLLLTSGDVVVATPSSMSVTKKSVQKLTDDLSWRGGVLIFKYTTLADAAAEFNRYNREKLVVADPAAARLTIVGTFPTNGVKSFTDAAQAIFGLRVDNRGSVVVISR